MSDQQQQVTVFEATGEGPDPVISVEQVEPFDEATGPMEDPALSGSATPALQDDGWSKEDLIQMVKDQSALLDEQAEMLLGDPEKYTKRIALIEGRQTRLIQLAAVFVQGGRDIPEWLDAALAEALG